MLEFSLLKVIKMLETKSFVVDRSWRVPFETTLAIIQDTFVENIPRFIYHFAVFIEKKTMPENLWNPFYGKLFQI